MTNIITSYAQLKSIFVSLMMADASEVVEKLKLPEPLPIRAENLVLASVRTPRMVSMVGLGGVINTTNWVYSFAHGGKLCFLVRRNPNFWVRSDIRDYRRFAVPRSVINTNSAYEVATNWLNGFGVDLPRLSRECRLVVRVKEILDMTIPEYALVWSRGDEQIASVWFLEPGKQLWQLRVEDPTYLLRPSLTNGIILKLPDLAPP